ncbi:MAG: DUF3109 family protein [Bacteroidales bacterium]|nr:DUF3109 family protein [Bacteroidales bacterium]
MLEIDKTVISTDLFTQQFTCDLKRCKGACCVQGDSGAPLDENEKIILEQSYPSIKPFLRPEGVNAIEKQGTSVIDKENDCVTPLVEGKECAYTVFENGIARCGIENAFHAGATTLRKPISCYLYPVRIKKYKTFVAVNYDSWSICEPARSLGKSLGLPVYKFTAPALRQKFGDEWFAMLQQAAVSVIGSRQT